ncbi:MAG TPA: DNA-binding protein [Geobacteraceae bacterium]
MNHVLRILCFSLAMAVSLNAFGAEPEAAKPAASPATVTPAETGHGAPATAAPAPAAEQPKMTGNISGKVLQTMNSGGYSYVYVETKEQKVWVAVPQTSVTVGEVMTFKPGMEMTNFPSTSLKRTFEKIVFSEGVVSGPSQKKELSSPGAGGALVSGGKIKVEKATGANAYTVSELYAKSAKLHKKKVVVRGQVVKVSANIMKKNWVHLQDGSGSAKKGTNNIVVTSEALPTVGDVVTVRGTLYKDKDFGGNYKYKVIIEGATIEAH